MGVITKTIGSAGGRDYTDLTSWAAALPANLVTDGNSYVASMYNDGEIIDTTGGSAPHLNLTGFTTDATHTITITAAAGQAWCDNAANVAGYVAANGVAIRRTDHRSTVIECDVNFVTISRLQLSGGRTAVNVIGESVTITNCVLETNNNNGVVNINGGNATIVNNFIIVNHASNGTFAIGIGRNGSNGPAVVVYNTIVRVSDYSAGDPVIGNHYGWSGTFTNNAFFGFTSTYDTAGMTGTNNGTDQSSVTGSSADQVSLTFANQFTTTTTTNEDFRLKSGNSLAGNGITFTGITTDAYGTTRAGSPAIGAFEPASTSFVGSASGSSTATATGQATATAVGSATGINSSTLATGQATAVTVGSGAGTSAAIAAGQTTISGIGAATGSSSASGIGQATASSVGASTGASSASATGAATITAIGSATGTSTATATGQASATVDGTATGTSTASGVPLTAWVGSASGTSTATATGQAIATVDGTATGVNTVALAVGIGLSPATGSATGNSTASATGVGAVTSVGSGAGSSTATGSGQALAMASGTASGASTATGIGVGVVTSVGTATGASTALGVNGGAVQVIVVASAFGSSVATAYGIGGALVRSADSGTMAIAIPQSGFSLAIEAMEPTLSSVSVVPFELDDGTNSNRAMIYLNNTSASAFDSVAGVDFVLGAALVANSIFTSVATFKAGAQTGSLNGAAVVANGTPAATNPTGINVLRFGTSASGGQFTGYLRRVRVWPRVLSSSEQGGITN